MAIQEQLQVSPSSSPRSPHSPHSPHVVAMAFITQGHINPLVHFCFELANKGVTVTFVTIHFNSSVFGTNKPDPEVPDHLKNKFRFERLHLEQAPAPDLVHSHNAFATFFQRIHELEAPFEEVVRRIEPKVSCIVSDCMLLWTQHVAKRLEIPRAGFWTTSIASLTVDCHVPLLMKHGDIPVNGENWDKTVDYVPGLASLPARSLPFMYHSWNLMTTTDPGYKRKIARSVVLKDDDWIIANSFEELEAAGFEALRKVMNRRCVGVGPLLPGRFLGDKKSDAIDKAAVHVVPGVASFWKQDTTCLKWLNVKAPGSVLYVSFGSAVKLTYPEFEELSRGLESSKQAFLWALRPGGVDGLKNEELESFKKRTSSTGLVIDWAPQVEVLCHESTGCFVTHCGWNSVLEGICGGVPMLGWPREAEQNINCELFVGMKIGLRLAEANKDDGRAFPRRDEIASKVTSVLNDEEMRARARKMRDATRNAVNGSSAANIQAFVNYLREM